MFSLIIYIVFWLSSCAIKLPDFCLMIYVVEFGGGVVVN